MPSWRVTHVNYKWPCVWHLSTSFGFLSGLFWCKVLSTKEAASCLDRALESNLDFGNLDAVGVHSAHCVALMHKETTNKKVVRFLQTVADAGKDEGDRAQVK